MHVVLDILFGLCAPSVSNGALERTFSFDNLIKLNDADAQALWPGEGHVWKLRSAERSIYVRASSDGCSVFSTESLGQNLRPEFLAGVKKMGGTATGQDAPNNDANTIVATIPLRERPFLGLIPRKPRGAILLTLTGDGESGDVFAAASGFKENK